MAKNLPHEKKVFELRNEALHACENCPKNKESKKEFMACGNTPPTNYPFHECPKRIRVICNSCRDEFDVPVIAYLWMKDCQNCFKRKRFVKGEGVR